MFSGHAMPCHGWWEAAFEYSAQGINYIDRIPSSLNTTFPFPQLMESMLRMSKLRKVQKLTLLIHAYSHCSQWSHNQELIPINTFLLCTKASILSPHITISFTYLTNYMHWEIELKINPTKSARFCFVFDWTKYFWLTIKLHSPLPPPPPLASLSCF